MKLKIKSVYRGSRFQDTCINEISTRPIVDRLSRSLRKGAKLTFEVIHGSCCVEDTKHLYVFNLKPGKYSGGLTIYTRQLPERPDWPLQKTNGITLEEGTDQYRGVEIKSWSLNKEGLLTLKGTKEEIDDGQPMEKAGPMDILVYDLGRNRVVWRYSTGKEYYRGRLKLYK